MCVFVRSCLFLFLFLCYLEHKFGIILYPVVTNYKVPHIERPSPAHRTLVLRTHNTKSPRGLCNGFTSGIKPSEFCTVLVYRG